MSAQAGVFYTDRRPIPLEVAERIDAALADFGPDSSGSRLEPGLLMLSRALHITPEDEREEQPLVSLAGRLLTWDGRLDNRDDLLLQFHRDLGIDATDGALALAVFERWGLEGFARLIGDWSLALWDAPERRLVLASDYMGVRPLYYRRAADHVAWSSSLGELVLREGVKDDLDDVFVVGFLVGFVPADRTPYLPVRSVTPAHALSFSAAGSTCHRFYEYPTNTIRYRHASEYEEHLREVFAKAVGTRLRSTRPVWAELSGGLDSSSVVCMADWISRSHHSARATAETPPALRTLSFISNGSPEVDERRFLGAVEDHCGLRGWHLDADDAVGLIDERGAWVTPRHPRDAWLAGLRHVIGAGGRLLLTGQGGDVVMANDPNWSHSAVELLHEGRLVAFLHETHAWSLGTKEPILHVWAHVASNALPTPSHISALGSRRKRMAFAGSPPLAGHRGLIANPALLERAMERSVPETESLRRYPARIRRTVSTLMEHTAERTMQTPSELPGLALSHPFLDRRLVETVLAMPQRVLNRPGETRALMRRAFEGILPCIVHRRFSKAYAAPFWARSLRSEAEALMQCPGETGTVRQGWLRAGGARAVLDAWTHGRAEMLGMVLSLVMTETWLKARRYDGAVVGQSSKARPIPQERR